MRGGINETIGKVYTLLPLSDKSDEPEQEGIKGRCGRRRQTSKEFDSKFGNEKADVNPSKRGMETDVLLNNRAGVYA